MTKPNEPAFPCQSELHGVQHHGVSKREYFAAMALQGLLNQHQQSDVSLLNEPVYNAGYINTEPTFAIEALARDAVSIADALIVELNKIAESDT